MKKHHWHVFQHEKLFEKQPLPHYQTPSQPITSHVKGFNFSSIIDVYSYNTRPKITLRVGKINPTQFNL
jgi:hypothetical protein